MCKVKGTQVVSLRYFIQDYTYKRKLKSQITVDKPLFNDFTITFLI